MIVVGFFHILTICRIILSTWLSTKSEIDVSPDNETPFMLDRYSQSGTWELLETSFADLPNSGELTRMEFSLTIRRLRGYYVVNIILPVVFLSFTASAVFFLPAEAGEKMGMSITVLLAYAVYLTIIADNMPQTSLQLSLLAVYLTMQLGATAVGVIMSTIVLHIHHKHEERKIGKRTKQYTRKLRNLFGINRKKKKADTTATSNTDREFTRTTSLSQAPLDTKHTPNLRGIRVTPYEEKANVKEKKCLSDDDDDGEEITWPKVAETLDKLIFVIMSIYIALTTLVTIPVLAIGGLFY